MVTYNNNQIARMFFNEIGSIEEFQEKVDVSFIVILLIQGPTFYTSKTLKLKNSYLSHRLLSMKDVVPELLPLSDSLPLKCCQLLLDVVLLHHWLL